MWNLLTVLSLLTSLQAGQHTHQLHVQAVHGPRAPLTQPPNSPDQAPAPAWASGPIPVRFTVQRPDLPNTSGPGPDFGPAITPPSASRGADLCACWCLQALWRSAGPELVKPVVPFMPPLCIKCCGSTYTALRA